MIYESDSVNEAPPRRVNRTLRRRGQMIVVFVLTWAIFVAGIAIVFNVGTLVGERIRIQQVADNAAYSGAVWQARCLNYLAYCNRSIIGNLAFLAYITAIISHMKAWSQYIEDISYVAAFIPYVGAVISQILSTIADIVEEIADVIEDVRDSDIWEGILDSIYAAQFAMVVYTEATLPAVVQEVAKDADINIELNGDGILSIPNVINIANFLELWKDAQGDGAGLRSVVSDTISSWTKGTDTGAIPLADRDWLFPARNPFAYTGIDGNFSVNSSGFRAQDYGYIRIGSPCFWHGWCMSTIPLTPWYTSERDIDWDDIGFFKFKDDIDSAAFYAVARKPGEALNAFLYRNFVAGAFGVSSGTLVVPDNDIMAVSRALVRYDDPQTGSSRYNTLKSQNRDPNLFNPFWHAQLTPLNHNFSGLPSGEDASKTASEAMLSTTIGSVWSLLDSDWEDRIVH